MLELQTERLRILALEQEHLILLREDPQAFEAAMGLNPSPLDAQKPLCVSLEEMLTAVENDPEHYYWYTNWKIILREEERLVGGFCFLGAPNAEGHVAVAYGIEEAFQHRGIMTESLRVMMTWAFRQPGVRALIAEVPRDNAAAARVLEKVGAEKVRENGAACWWKIGKRG